MKQGRGKDFHPLKLKVSSYSVSVANYSEVVAFVLITLGAWCVCVCRVCVCVCVCARVHCKM